MTAACSCQIRRRLRQAVLLSQIPVATRPDQLLRSRCIQLIQSAEISWGQTASHSRFLFNVP